MGACAILLCGLHLEIWAAIHQPNWDSIFVIFIQMLHFLLGIYFSFVAATQENANAMLRLQRKPSIFHLTPCREREVLLLEGEGEENIAHTTFKIFLLKHYSSKSIEINLATAC